VIGIPGYRTWATNDVPSAADFNEVLTDPLQADVATDETRTSSTYGDLATVGPSVTKTLVAGQKVLVEVSVYIGCTTDSIDGLMSFAVSGASTLAAADANAADGRMAKTAVSADIQATRGTVYTAINAGSHTFTAKYKCSDNVSTMHFINRRIIIKPF
jgi:hypothetical protein